MKVGWEYKKLGEVCDKASSNVVINKVENDNGEYPLFGASGLVKNVSFFHRDAEYIGIVKDGAGVGRVDIYPPYSSLVGTMQYILPKDECLIGYLKYFLIKLNLSKYVSGATIPHIYFKDYGKELIPVPSIEIQQSIVSELDLINELIAKKKAQLTDLDSLAQSLFYEMFGDPVENEKGWDVKKYGDEFEIGSGGTPSKTKPEYWESGNIPWIGSNMCQNSIINETDRKFITEEGLSHSNAKLLVKGTVLVALVGATIGKTALLRTSTSTNQNIAFIKVSDNKEYNSYFVFYHMMSLYEEFMNIGNGDFKMANLSFVRSLPIIKPPLPLQQTFASRIEAIEEEKQKIQSSLKDLETLLASRMQYWFD